MIGLMTSADAGNGHERDARSSVQAANVSDEIDGTHRLMQN